MTCPYCLAFSRDAAKKAIPNTKTLVDSYWEFEEGGRWTGFTPSVSGLLEKAYQNWIRDPDLRRAPQVKSGNFLYTVDYAAMKPTTPDHATQRIRRVGVVGDEKALNTGTCTVNNKLFKEFQSERDKLKAQVEELKKERSEDVEAHRRQLEDLRTELQRLRETSSEQQAQLAELDVLRDSLTSWQEASAQLQHHLAGIFPGRIVVLTAAVDHGGLPPGLLPGDLGRVRAMEGPAAAVDFPGKRGVWLPRTNLMLATGVQWLTRPGTRVKWCEEHCDRGGGHASSATRRGVVCDSVDGVTVHILGADGTKQVRDLRGLVLDMEPRAEDFPLEAGDMVQVHSDAGLGVLRRYRLHAESIGMVVRNEGGSVSVRFRDPHADLDDEGHLDLSFEVHEADIRRDEAVDHVRPGASVRVTMEPPGVAPLGAPAAVGIVYALHGDGIAIVDFLGNMGYRCSAACLEVVEAPTTAEHAVLRLISECLSWCEVSAQHSEDREEEWLLRLLSMLPSPTVPLPAPASLYATAA
mmetsp:Transcript_90991/g.253288  ORF Transcript_90991/g.253288 Transcript_90991/m.253288 type:complete len:522 (+) Transcript_90991:106-1671(+)